MSRVRDHWSIGEVLSLLQDEFPEVTISKIRFLESQGLIDPERTGSGYRKFADVDYDRLYWILEQQRDHYLPLRVIRDRLEEGQEIGAAPRRSDLRIGDRIAEPAEEVGDSVVESQTGEVDGDPEAGLDGSFSDVLAEVAAPVTADDQAHPVRDEGSNALAAAMGAQPYDQTAEPEAVELTVIDTDVPAEQVVQVDGPEIAMIDTDEPAPEIADVAQPDVHDQTEDHQEQPEPVPDDPQPAAEEPEWIAPEDPVAPDSEPIIMTEAVAAKLTMDSEDQSPPDQEGTEPVPERKPAPRLLGTRSEKPRPVTKTTSEALKPPPRPSLPGSSVALTREELAEQSGTTPGMIAELEKYGMVSPRQVGGSVLFDSTALTVARLAVQFGRYGLEPRHLKTFRLGAEREVALLTQSIGPTLKANNPETRRRSYDTLHDLAELSASLRSIIVRDLVADLEPDG